MWDEIQDMPGEIFELSLRDRCLAVAEAQAWEINGDIDRIDPADLEGQADAFKAAGVPYTSLTNYASLIELAVEKGMVDANTQSTLMEWRDSPSTWKQ